MVFYFVQAIAAAAAFGLIRWGRTIFFRLAISSTRVLDVMLGDQDEDEKLEELQGETLKLILSLLSFIGLILAAGLVFIGILYAYLILSELDFQSAPSLGLWQSILALSIGATLPFLIPFSKSPSGYSELAKLLHRMVLNNYQLGFKLYRRELKNRALKPRQDFLIVSGLARAGTTSLMNQLAQMNGFRSLNYANMPFLLSPNTWARFYKPKNGPTKERSHKDGIQIGLQSNEALEEYFWKALAKDAYIGESQLREYSLSADAAQEYLRYQSLVRQSEAEVYLAKNNNFLLRYQSLREHLPDFKMVLLFREPLMHAASLMEKHRQYQSLQKEDSFVKEYMDWLGHHEFGLGQKPFQFEGQELPQGNKDSLDYWLQIWIQYYQKALSLADQNLRFIAYETFCKDPQTQLEAIVQSFDLSAERPKLQAFINKRPRPERPESQYLKTAEELYQKLLLRAEPPQGY